MTDVKKIPTHWIHEHPLTEETTLSTITYCNGCDAPLIQLSVRYSCLNCKVDFCTKCSTLTELTNDQTYDEYQCSCRIEALSYIQNQIDTRLTLNDHFLYNLFQDIITASEGSVCTWDTFTKHFSYEPNNEDIKTIYKYCFSKPCLHSGLFFCFVFFFFFFYFVLDVFFV